MLIREVQDGNAIDEPGAVNGDAGLGNGDDKDKQNKNVFIPKDLAIPKQMMPYINREILIKKHPIK